MTTQPNVGLMLYTIRDECARDLEGVLRTVAEIGYDGVELYQLHGHDPEAVRRWLDETGLVAVGRHAGLDALESDLPALAAELRVLGTDRIVLSWIDPPESVAVARAAVERIAAIAARAHDLDLQFGFHNHWGELRPFEEGVTTLDLLAALPPELLWLELDLGWIWEAEADPVTLLERLAGRCPLVHVKDLRSRGSREHCPVGDGAVGYDRILPAAVRAGVEWLIVEQETYPFPPLVCAEKCLRNFEALLTLN